MDLFSFCSGRIALGKSPEIQSLEIIAPPVLRFRQDTYFILTGAGYRRVRLVGNRSREINHRRVYLASQGDTLEFQQREYGFRTYLSLLSADHKTKSTIEGTCLADISRPIEATDPSCIRVLRGPEFNLLKNPEDFTGHAWQISPDMDTMGMRLRPLMRHLQFRQEYEMISEAVCDGCVQLSPAGPIILLRGRQTVGGYPRIFSVISADLDRLAQYSPLNTIHFREADLNEAIQALREYQSKIDNIRVNHKGF